MSEKNLKFGYKYEDIGRKHLKFLGYKELDEFDVLRSTSRLDYNCFDFITESVIFEIKSKRLPCSSKYTFDFTKRQIDTYRESKYDIKVLLVLIHSDNKHKFRIFNMSDFQNMDRVFNYKVFGGLKRIRLTLKREKRNY